LNKDGQATERSGRRRVPTALAVGLGAVEDLGARDRVVGELRSGDRGVGEVFGLD